MWKVNLLAAWQVCSLHRRVWHAGDAVLNWRLLFSKWYLGNMETIVFSALNLLMFTKSGLTLTINKIYYLHVTCHVSPERTKSNGRARGSVCVTDSMWCFHYIALQITHSQSHLDVIFITGVSIMSNGVLNLNQWLGTGT